MHESKSNFYYDIYANNMFLRRYLSGKKAVEHYNKLYNAKGVFKVTMKKIKRQKLSTGKKEQNQ